MTTWAMRLLHVVAPAFQCELRTSLRVDEVRQTMQEHVSNDFPWPWKRRIWFRGTVGLDQFRIADIERDDGVSLHGTVASDGDETRINIRVRMGAMAVFGSLFLALVATGIISIGLGFESPARSFLSLAVLVVCYPIFHLYVRSVYWNDIDQTLEVLCAVLNAEVVSRSHD